MNMTEFVGYVANEYDLTKVDAKKEVDHVLQCILDVLNEVGEVNLTGFGKFYVKEVAEATRRNPKNGEPVIVPAHRAPKFNYASNVKKEIR